MIRMHRLLSALLLGLAMATTTWAEEYTTVTAADLKANPKSFWARGIVFTDTVENPSAGEAIKLGDQKYLPIQTRVLGTCYVDAALATPLHADQEYAFSGTVYQKESGFFSSKARYYVAIKQATAAVKNAGSLSLASLTVGSTNNPHAQALLTLDALLAQALRDLQAYCSSSNIDIKTVFDPASPHHARAAQAVRQAIYAEELRAKVPAVEYMVSLLTALLAIQQGTVDAPAPTPEATNTVEATVEPSPAPATTEPPPAQAEPPPAQAEPIPTPVPEPEPVQVLEPEPTPVVEPEPTASTEQAAPVVEETVAPAIVEEPVAPMVEPAPEQTLAPVVAEEPVIESAPEQIPAPAVTEEPVATPSVEPEVEQAPVAAPEETETTAWATNLIDQPATNMEIEAPAETPAPEPAAIEPMPESSLLPEPEPAPPVRRSTTLPAATLKLPVEPSPEPAAESEPAPEKKNSKGKTTSKHSLLDGDVDPNAPVPMR